MIVQLGDLPAIVPRLQADVVTASEVAVRSLVVATGKRFQTETPFLTGAAKASIVGWVGDQPGGASSGRGRRKRRTRHTARSSKPQREDSRERSRTAHRGGSGVSASDFASAFDEWHLPLPLGLTMTVPYAHKLSAGESHQQPKGWVPALVHDVVSQYRESGG